MNEIEWLKARIAELEKIVEAQQKRIEELERRLRIYENPHVPSSKRIIKEPTPEKTPKKRGAPEGHAGTTRKVPIPDKVIELKPTRCTKCESKKIRILKEHKKIVEDIEIIKTTTEFYYYDCICEKCNNKFTTSDVDLPREGNFGPNITALWQNLHYVGTIPFDRLSKISENCFGVGISPAGIHNVIYRTAKIFQPNFERIKRRVSKSKHAQSDETSQSFNGKNWWLWNFSTKNDVLVLLRNSRGSKVLKELFGDFFDGVLSSDCFSAYNKFRAREYQKCWAHILTDAEDLGKHSVEGKRLHEMLSQMYNYIKKMKKEKLENTPKVRAWVMRAKKEMNLWLDKNWETKAVMNLVLRIGKYVNDWFTCLKYPYVEPTINRSEREIRKSVIARKISGLHRSDLGLHSREAMMSTILTLEKRGGNPFEFIQNEIEKYNLGPGPPAIS